MFMVVSYTKTLNHFSGEFMDTILKNKRVILKEEDAKVFQKYVNSSNLELITGPIKFDKVHTGKDVEVSVGGGVVGLTLKNLLGLYHDTTSSRRKELKALSGGAVPHHISQHARHVINHPKNQGWTLKGNEALYKGVSVIGKPEIHRVTKALSLVCKDFLLKELPNSMKEIVGEPVANNTEVTPSGIIQPGWFLDTLNKDLKAILDGKALQGITTIPGKIIHERHKAFKNSVELILVQPSIT